MKPSQSLRTALRSLRPLRSRTTSSSIKPRTKFTSALLRSRQPYASLSTTPYRSKGIAPDSSNPSPPNTESQNASTSSTSPAAVSESEYHEIADQYLDTLVLALEEKAENTETLEVEYSAGVLTITHPRGVYVLNKQPPNKQIWLSSPVSGPKRYDWVLKQGAGMHEKEGSEAGADAGDDGQGGKWVYLRDGSELTELLRKEVGVTVAPEGEADVTGGREGPGGGGTVGGAVEG